MLSFLHFLWTQSHHEQAPGTVSALMIRHFGWNLGTLLVAAFIVQGALGRRAPTDVERDERDLRIKHAADRAGNTILTIVVISCAVLLGTLPRALLEWWLAPLIAAHVLIGVLICKSLAENAWLVACYARERR